MRALSVVAALIASVTQTPQTPAPSPVPPPPATDIYVLAISGGPASMGSAKPQPVSTTPGYDNQPMFSDDGGRILFAANRDGKQIDVFVFDRARGAASQLTETAENENSPTFLPAGIGEAEGFSAVRTEADRTQRLWRFDAHGRNPQLVLADVKPVGYHAWVDADTVALFILGPPITLRIARVPAGTAEIAAQDIGRSLHRVPGSRLVSFVQRERTGQLWIKQIDVESKKIETLVRAVDGSTDGDMAWMPDGRTILMSSGTRVWSWTRGTGSWTEVFDGTPHGLGAVSRIAVSPKGDAVAIVVAEPKK